MSRLASATRRLDFGDARKCNREDLCAEFTAAEFGNACDKLPNNWHYNATPHALRLTLQRV
jgi:hypothetical protein